MLDSYKIDETKGERRKLFCNSCQRTTIHTAEAKCVGRWDSPDGMFYGGQSDRIMRCGACDEVSFLREQWDSESYFHDQDGNMIPDITEKQFPVPLAKDFSFDQDHTSGKLNELLHELISAHAASLPIATTMMLRLVVEFIADDLNCKGRTLAKKIDAMFDNQLIDSDQKALFHKIRELGNSGAHSALAMQPTQIVAAMGVINLLIEKHYNAPGREKQIMERAQAALK